MKNIIDRLRLAARDDPGTVWFDVVSKAGIEYAEEVFGFEIPKTLRRSYREISNGGFGPGYHIIGLPGGEKSSWGDLLETWNAFQGDEGFEDGWLPIIDWGCGRVSLIDCDNDFLMVTCDEGEFHLENDSFDELLERWMGGELPEWPGGGLDRP